MEFITNLLSNSKKVSSKRFTSLYSLLLLTIVVAAILYGIAVPEALIYGLVALVAGSSALTTINTKTNQEDEKY